MALSLLIYSKLSSSGNEGQEVLITWRNLPMDPLGEKAQGLLPLEILEKEE